MGRLFEYKCKSCGYSVNANPKGHDAIMMGEMEKTDIVLMVD